MRPGRPNAQRAFAMEPRCRRGSRKRRQALRHEADGDAGKHVARPAVRGRERHER